MHTSSRKKVLFTVISLLSIIGYGVFVFAAPPGVGGYNPGEILDPECAPNDPDCIVAVSGGSGWSLTGNTGTTAGTNFIGTTDTQNFVIKTNNKQIAVFGQNGNISLGSANVPYGWPAPLASGSFSFATGTNTVASAFASAAFGQSTLASSVNSVAFGVNTTSSGGNSASFGEYTTAAGNGSAAFGSYTTAHGSDAVTFGDHTSTDANAASAFGVYTNAQGVGESVFGTYNKQYSAYDFGDTSSPKNRLFSIGNGTGIGSEHNAYTLWKDGSFAYNDDNFQNDNPGTEQNMFYFNYGNHDGLGSVQTKPAIRLGSAINNEWNINSANVGDRSVAIGFGNVIASGDYATALGNSSTASGDYSTALGYYTTASGQYSTAFGMNTGASGNYSTAFGISTIASGLYSTAFGASSYAGGTYSFSGGNSSSAAGNSSFVFGNYSSANGNVSVAMGDGIYANSLNEVVFGSFNTLYVPVGGTTSWNIADRLFSVANGDDVGQEHNAYTLWKDGSFAYNDDNFQNDSGTEQNIFYFNYGNQDGLGDTQTKRAIRLGSALGGEWDINSVNVGNRSIALGFGDSGLSTEASIASGLHSFAFGTTTVASGSFSTAFGIGSTASATSSTAFGSGSVASGNVSTAFGNHSFAYSFGETAFGMFGTDYVPLLTNAWAGPDRLLNIGNGDGRPLLGPQDFSDAFTILKNGDTGIGIDNFETYSNGNIFQVGDGSNVIIGYVDDNTGNWVAVSDERKKQNITDLNYGLNEILQLQPKSFEYKRNGEHTIGFIAQQVLPIVPESVYGSESEGYGMSYTTLTPVIVKAIQEMNLNITNLSDMTRSNTWRDSLIAWFGNVENGIGELFAKRAHVEQLCIGTSNNETCLTKDQIDTILNSTGTTPYQPTVSVPTVDPVPTIDQEIDNSITTGDQSVTSNEDISVPETEIPTETTTNETTE